MKRYVWEIGFILGAAGTGLVTRLLYPDLNPILRLVIIAIVGVCVGWASHSLTHKKQE